MRADASGKTRVSTNRLIAWSIGFAIVFVVAISMVASSSNPDPTDVATGEQSLVTSVVNASVIVFREGLEAVLIFAAITASFLGQRQHYRRPVMLGVASAFAATVLTWFVMTSLVQSLPFSQDVLLAITGIAAVVILLLVMNWFFHKVYWTDHIKDLNSKKRELVDASEAGEQVKYWGFVALGFSAVYREGFEVVLFLQNLNLVAGTAAVMWGVLLGLAGTTIVGFLTFYLHHKLPYKRMLVLTGVLLGLVLVVMVGGSARTLQTLGVVSTTPLPFGLPEWWARWFEIVPTYESIAIQALAAVFVVGSYYAAEWWAVEKRRRRSSAATPTESRAISIPSVRIEPDAAIPAPGARAAARARSYAAAPHHIPSTVCGVAATTMCGAPATVAVAAADSRLPHAGPNEPTAAPQPMAPALRNSDWTPTPVRLALPKVNLALGPAFAASNPITAVAPTTAAPRRTNHVLLARPGFELPSFQLRAPQPTRAAIGVTGEGAPSPAHPS